MTKKTGYAAGPPWKFVGRAWYQLSLVKSGLAKKLIPPELRVVEAFGHTLGGVYYAEYDASPAGPFREMVVIPGIVWNPPTSCAWAASVMVDNKDAKVHGIQGVGLPSRLASFKPTKMNLDQKASAKSEPAVQAWKDADVLVEQFTTEAASATSSGKQQPLCSIRFPSAATFGKSTFPFHLQPPLINLHLPSFSGRTKQQPQMLQYTCQLQCRPRLVSAAQFRVPLECTAAPGIAQQKAQGSSSTESAHVAPEATQRQLRFLGMHLLPSRRDIQEILTSKPLVAFSFDDMTMTVGEPSPVVTKGSAARDLAPQASLSAA